MNSSLWVPLLTKEGSGEVLAWRVSNLPLAPSLVRRGYTKNRLKEHGSQNTDCLPQNHLAFVRALCSVFQRVHRHSLFKRGGLGVSSQPRGLLSHWRAKQLPPQP